MTEVDAGTEHHGAASLDHADIVLAAVLDCLRRDTRTLRHGAVHPDAVDPGVSAFVHDLLRGLRTCDDHYAVDATGDRSQVGITAIALEGLHVRIDRKYLMPHRLQPAIDQIAGRMMAVVPGHARNRDALLSQEVLY